VQFVSHRYAGITFPIKGPEKQFFQDGSDRTIRPALVADFAEQALTANFASFRPTEVDAASGDYVGIRAGGWFDTEEAQRRKGWTDEERTIVENELLRYCRNNPNPDPFDKQLDSYGAIELYKEPVPTPPWPTYDSMHHFAIPKFARQSGLVQQALAYEQRMLNRPGVIEKLREIAEETVGEESLTAV
jgi:hypothetical protein